MGVYINMEMPQSCPSCPFNRRAWYEDSHRCLASNKQITVNLKTGFDDNCPLVPVPPHGDLIDRDALMDSDGDLWDGMWGWSGVQIANAPTIVPAEEGEHEQVRQLQTPSVHGNNI